MGVNMIYWLRISAFKISEPYLWNRSLQLLVLSSTKYCLFQAVLTGR